MNANKKKSSDDAKLSKIKISIGGMDFEATIDQISHEALKEK